MPDQPQNPFPSPQDFFLKIPLYDGYPFDAIKPILEIEFYQDTIDTYCIKCGRDSVFKSDVGLLSVYGENTKAWNLARDVGEILTARYINIEHRDSVFFPENISSRTPPPSEYYASNRFFVVSFHCTREPSHLIRYCFVVQDSTVTKIGQYPSIADLENAHLQKYREVLSKEKYRELNRAVGLTTHGVGIGAFVYLRRIFEDLLEEARVSASSAASWDNNKFTSSHIDEKILLLKDHLPQFLVENRKLYAILSLGIHELTEAECLKYFSVVKLAIELILDEKLRQKEAQSKISEASKALGDLLTNLKSK